MKKNILVLMSLIFFLLLTKSVSASTIVGATIEVSPGQGDIARACVSSLRRIG